MQHTLRTSVNIYIYSLTDQSRLHEFPSNLDPFLPFCDELLPGLAKSTLV